MSNVLRDGGFAINLQRGPRNTQTGRLDRRTLLNKRYMIVRTIGQGGMGAVYQARDLRRQTICAIKEMSLSMVPPAEQEQAVQNFKAEAQMLAGLNHPNLPTFSGFFTEGQRHFLVMEYIDGLTLENLLEHNNGPFPERRVLGWARQLCNVLTYLHSQHPLIIFRDMKPGNIMLMRNGRIKLIDFGIARFFRHAGSHDTQLLGTPGFAPPEQYGKAQTDERSDIYSLAMTLFQLMTNTLSEKGFGLQDVHLVNPSISLPVARALEKATALSAEDRFQNVEMFRRALFGEGTFMFENGDQAATAAELADLCIRFPEEAADYLFAGEIEAWFQEVGDADLARATRNLREVEHDPMAAVEQFLHMVLGPSIRLRGNTGKHTATRSSQVGKAIEASGSPVSQKSRSWLASKPAPDIVVQPRTLNFGEVEPELSDPLLLTIIDSRGTLIQGAITTHEPWIVIDQTSFRSPSTRINVRIDATHLRGAMHYSGTILVIPDEDDEEQDLVVKVEVDVLGRLGLNTIPTPIVSGKSEKGQFRDAYLDNDEEDEEDAMLSPAGDGMVLVPRTGLYDDIPSNGADAVAINASNANNPKYSKYRTKYSSSAAGGNATSSSWDPLQASARQRLLLQWSLTIFAAFMAASLCYTVLAEMPSLVHTSLLPPNPWFIAVLLSMVPTATLGALVVNWNHTWSIRETLNRLCTGLSTTLVALSIGEFLWKTFVHLNLPSSQLFTMLLLVALASSIGTHPSVSKQIIGRVIWAIENARWVVIGAAMVVGGVLGFVVTLGFALTCFTPFSIVAGSGMAAALILWVDHQLKPKKP